MYRRQFISLSALSALQIALLGNLGACRAPRLGDSLVQAGDLFDLAPGFQYVVIQRGGDALSDGHTVPFQPDGMACFAQDDGTWVLLRNHELGGSGQLEQIGLRTSWGPNDNQVPSPAYDNTKFGGVSRVVIDPNKLKTEFAFGTSDIRSKSVIRSNMALAGTEANCSGGQIPEGWVSCEETDSDQHGWAFLVKPTDSTLSPPRRIDNWGRLRREGIALDEKTGIVYMSEDSGDGCLYRFVPNNPKEPMGVGTLQALTIDGLKSAGTDVNKGQKWKVRWVDIEDPQAKETSCRAQAAQSGATTFIRTEGIVFDGTSVWFICTNGGPMSAGQIFQYTPKTERLKLAEQVTDRSVLSMPDNCIITPWGDLMLAEDNYLSGDGCTHQHLRLLTRNGKIINLARNRKNEIPGFGAPGSEFTGPCFSPDGTILFVNLQSPLNLTVAITGPWPQRSRG